MVKLSLMPKGVEHLRGDGWPSTTLSVKLSLMPKGVEHPMLVCGRLPVLSV